MRGIMTSSGPGSHRRHRSEPAVDLRLEQNYPNPFNPSTKIEYAIPTQAQVELKVYNLVGQEVATLVNEMLPAGVHSARFDALKSCHRRGTHRLTAGDFTSVKKMLLLK